MKSKFIALAVAGLSPISLDGLKQKRALWRPFFCLRRTECFSSMLSALQA